VITVRLPPEAKRVYKGVIYSVYQWDQKMFDGSTEVFERLKRRDSVQIIATKGDRILVSYEEQPSRGAMVGLLGGGVNDAEEPLAAAKRELIEETGLLSDDWELWWAFDPNPDVEWTAYIFIARNCYVGGTAKAEAGERITVKEFSFEEFLKIASTPGFRVKDLTTRLIDWQIRDPQRIEEFRKKLF
jgi:ADP-ribose pyrophosphatase